jgi:hypothetical protein
MDRTVPSRASDEINLYIRTYYSLLRRSREVEIKTLVEAHTRMNSALHVAAHKLHEFDTAAFIYVILRIPACLQQTRLVIMGQSEQVFRRHGFKDVESWRPVSAPGRRRYSFFDGRDTLAVYIASRSDIDDLIPSITAYQIERNKLRHLLNNKPAVLKLLDAHADKFLDDDALLDLADLTHIPVDDLERLRRIWGAEMAGNLAYIARHKQRISVQLLGGSLANYKRATNRWWQLVEDRLADIEFADRPAYFVSSNTHSLVNLLSGFALQREKALVEFVANSGAADLQTEYNDILKRNVPSKWENFLYYVLKKYEAVYPEVSAERVAHEEAAGIRRVPSRHVFDVEVQVTELNKLIPDWLDSRLKLPGIEKLRQSDALIINIDFPLGMAAYQVLSEISRNIADFRGIYIMGKAATLNGRIGDVMIPNVVHDEQSLNTYLFPNQFTADDVAPHLVYGTVMDNQKALTAPGTFLQNDSYMGVFYREGYAVMEMEAGPYLSAAYEMIRPERYPHNELVTMHNAPFPIGMLHYASDTPFSKGKNLGSQNLSYFGMDPTYACSIAILRAILKEERKMISEA